MVVSKSSKLIDVFVASMSSASAPTTSDFVVKVSEKSGFYRPGPTNLDGLSFVWGAIFDEFGRLFSEYGLARMEL